jgi:hypothetical protein
MRHLNHPFSLNMIHTNSKVEILCWYDILLWIFCWSLFNANLYTGYFFLYDLNRSAATYFEAPDQLYIESREYKEILWKL